MREQSSRAYGQRGAALFIVLMFAAVLSGLAAVAMRSSMSGARAAALYADVMQADELGRATADLVAHYVETGGPERRRGGGFEVRLHKVNIAIDYVSESGRVDANEAPLELIGALLGAAGASSSEVEAIEAGIVRFRSQKKPAAATPGTAPPGQRTANPPDTVAVRVPEPEDGGAASLSGGSAPLIQHRNLIAQAWDLPPALARAVLPSLTVASRSAKVDPVLADKLVLAALLGGDPDRVDAYIQQREQGFSSAESALAPIPSPGRGFASFSDASVFRALARVTVAGRFQRRYEVVLQVSDRPGQLPDVLSWQPLI